MRAIAWYLATNRCNVASVYVAGKTADIFPETLFTKHIPTLYDDSCYAWLMTNWAGAPLDVSVELSDYDLRRDLPWF
jgi:hypothetical protein